MDAAKEYMYIMSRKTLSKWVIDGDTKAAIEYLKRRDKRYSDKVENTDKVEVTIKEFEV